MMILVVFLHLHIYYYIGKCVSVKLKLNPEPESNFKEPLLIDSWIESGNMAQRSIERLSKCLSLSGEGKLPNFFQGCERLGS